MAIVVFTVSCLGFAAVSVFQAAFLPLGREEGLPWPKGDVPARPVRMLISRYSRTAALLSLLRAAWVLAAGLSLGAWGLSGVGIPWVSAFALILGTILLLLLLHGIAGILGAHFSRGVLLIVAPVLVPVSWTMSPLFWAWEQIIALARRRRPDVLYPGIEQPGSSGAEPLSPMEADIREADPHERRMISAILTLEDVTAREIMVPRVDIMAVPLDTTLPGVVSLMTEGGHSRVLVYQETIDNVVGIVHARDVLQPLAFQEGPVTLAEVARPALFVPDSMPLDRLLREFQERRTSIAVVVDEYGGTEGLVTIQDLLEEIVGELEDEFATGEPAIVRLNEREALVDGRVTVEEINELFGTRLEGDGFHTVAGLLSARLGKIPAPGDSVSLEGLSLKVLSTAGRRVRQVSVHFGLDGPP